MNFILFFNINFTNNHSKLINFLCHCTNLKFIIYLFFIDYYLIWKNKSILGQEVLLKIYKYIWYVFFLHLNFSFMSKKHTQQHVSYKIRSISLYINLYNFRILRLIKHSKFIWVIQNFLISNSLPIYWNFLFYFLPYQINLI